MKKQLMTITAAALVAFGAISCNKATQQENTSSVEVAETKTEKQVFTFDKANTSVLWTAFKFTEKAGVGGKFDEFEVTPKVTSAESPMAIMNALTFSIPVSSVNSSNPDRDGKLREHFFGKMANTEAITGTIKAVEGDDKAGTATVTVKLNDVEKDLSMKYTVSEKEDDAPGTIRLTGTIDVAEFGATPALEALNGVCEDLHKGSDGKSVLWPTVDVVVKSVLSTTAL
ncbi:YceI family protein [Limibacter armeniacum]|uniref:YceI family protein n=1 Tax=Limibacter armeniacum TaxID=466084 RepID=UPI002FE51C96